MKSNLISVILDSLKKDNIKVDIESVEPLDALQKNKQGDDILNSESESLLFFVCSFVYFLFNFELVNLKRFIFNLFFFKPNNQFLVLFNF